ncbi:MAG: HEAT repeat domain-containing protein [Planctomycetes bacterium]|nr:HEAT repeat domain-containing protein [Planctomycetota bacterium]
MPEIAVRRGLVPALALAFLAACGAEPPSGNGTPSKAPPGLSAGTGSGGTPTPEGAASDAPKPVAPPITLTPWHADFPGAPTRPHLSPREPGRTYDRTRRQALEAVVRKAAGAGTKESWRFARDFCGRLAGEDASVMVEALDRALQTKEESDWAENLLGSLATAKVPAAADAILRALESPRDALRDAAMEALVGCGTLESVRVAGGMIDRVGTRGIKAWADAARRFLPPEEIIAGYRRILADARAANVHSPVADAALLLPIDQALAVFEAFGDDVPILVRTRLVALHQATGDTAAELALREMLRSKDPAVRREAVAVLPLARLDDLLHELLQLSTDPDPMVRLGLVAVLGKQSGEDVDLTLDSLAVDSSAEVRRAALAQLVLRQRRGVLDDLVQTVRTGTGAGMSLAIQDLVAARDPGVIPPLVERLNSAPDAEKDSFLRAIALTTAAQAFAPLRDVFLAVGTSDAKRLGLIATLIPNCRGAEGEMLEFFRALPKADYVRRALLMNALANVALDRGAVEVAAPIFAELRRVFADTSELPQIRLFALEVLRRDLTLDDQVRLRAMLRTEAPGMREVLQDFLFEFF